MSKNIFQSKLPDSGIYPLGFKGKGMCSWCNRSEFYPQSEFNKQLYCHRYNSSCKQVSRNCAGIISLRKSDIHNTKSY